MRKKVWQKLENLIQPADPHRSIQVQHVLEAVPERPQDGSCLGLGIGISPDEVGNMAKIVIKDLVESQELDRQALTKIVGGKGPALPWQGSHRNPLWPSTSTIAESRKPLGAWLKSLTGD